MAVDFSKLDARGLSEELQFLQLNDQFTGVPLEDEDGPAGFMIRGAISRTAQKNLNKLYAEMRRKSEAAKKRADAVTAAEAAEAAGEDTAAKLRARADALLAQATDEPEGFEGAHQAAVDEAMCYIHSAVNFTWGDEGPVGDNPVLIRKMLDASFPILKPDSDGNLRAVNMTYSKQVNEAAEEYGRFLDNLPKG